MKGLYKYSILKKLDLIILYHQNDLRLNRLKNVIQDLFLDKNYDPSYKLLIDWRLSKTNVEIKEIEDYGNWIQEIHNPIGERSIVFLTPSHPDSVMRSLTSSFQKNHNFNSTCKLKWSLELLDIPLSNIEIIENEIEMMLEDDLELMEHTVY